MLVVPSLCTELAVQGRRDPWGRTFLVQNRKERGRCRVALSFCGQSLMRGRRDPGVYIPDRK
jgi:hypothetical protein